jgi:hypothetical protein
MLTHLEMFDFKKGEMSGRIIFPKQEDYCLSKAKFSYHKMSVGFTNSKLLLYFIFEKDKHWARLKMFSYQITTTGKSFAWKLNASTFTKLIDLTNSKTFNMLMYNDYFLIHSCFSDTCTVLIHYPTRQQKIIHNIGGDDYASVKGHPNQPDLVFINSFPSLRLYSVDVNCITSEGTRYPNMAPPVLQSVDLKLRYHQANEIDLVLTYSGRILHFIRSRSSYSEKDKVIALKSIHVFKQLQGFYL